MPKALEIQLILLYLLVKKSLIIYFTISKLRNALKNCSIVILNSSQLNFLNYQNTFH